METNWFLHKHADGGVFGPLSLGQLVRWAGTARIAPQDLVSPDERTWMKAPMLEELGMDWLVELTTERYYGPTTLGAIQEFVRLGEVTPESFVINTRDGSRRQIREIERFFAAPEEEPNGASEQTPAASGMSIKVEERIRDLERSLREERRALQEAEDRYRELEERYQGLLSVSSEETRAV
jgi:hypothetical protein